MMRPPSPKLFSSDREESTKIIFSKIFFKTILPNYTKYLYKKILINQINKFHKFFESRFGKIPDLSSKISNLIYHNFNLASVIINILFPNTQSIATKYIYIFIKIFLYIENIIGKIISFTYIKNKYYVGLSY